MPPEASDLHALVAAELDAPVPPAVAALAAQVAGRFGDSSRAVLFYGSALRADALAGLMLDFYVVVDDYAAAYGRSSRGRWLARANRRLPPNVFRIVAGELSAKYAVLDAADFFRLCSPVTRNPAVWARFAQPARLAWVRDAAARHGAIAVVAQAPAALLGAAAPVMPRELAVGAMWSQAFALTYATELRAERTGRAASLVDADPARYATFAAPALAAAGIAATITGGRVRLHAPADPAATGDWARRRRAGKALHAARLLKAASTFDGGLDYLAWKIERHAGVPVPVRDWQRRWPLLGGLSLLPRLLRTGAVR